LVKLTHDKNYTDLFWNTLWTQGGFDNLKLESLQENLVITLHFISQVLLNMVNMNFELLNNFNSNLKKILTNIFESSSVYCEKWRNALVTDNKFFNDPKYLFTSDCKISLVNEFYFPNFKYVSDVIKTDKAAEAKLEKEQHQQEQKNLEEYNKIMKNKLVQYTNFKKNISNNDLTKLYNEKDISNLTKIFKTYIQIIFDPNYSCWNNPVIKEKKEFEEFVKSFTELVSTSDPVKSKINKTIIAKLQSDKDIHSLIESAKTFLENENKKRSNFTIGIDSFKKNINNLELLIFPPKGSASLGKPVVTGQDIQNQLLKTKLIKLKKALNSLKTKLQTLQHKLKKLSTNLTIK
jgi:hypothetical protein